MRRKSSNVKRSNRLYSSKLITSLRGRRLARTQAPPPHPAKTRHAPDARQATCALLVEVWVCAVAGNDDALSAVVIGPLDAKGRIVPTHAVGRLRHIRRGHLIVQLRLVGERLEAVGEAFGHIEHEPIFGRQL